MSRNLPRISINRLDSGVYEWILSIEDDRLEGDIGESSIAECLISALSPLPLDWHHVEIKYRSVHMGTFNVVEVSERPDLVADRISEAYAALF